VLEPGGVIAGWVRNEAGEGIPEAFLYPCEMAERKGALVGGKGIDLRTATDAEGRFAIHLPEGAWKLFVKAEAYATTETEFLRTGTLDNEIVLTEGSTVTGRVIHATPREQLPGVWVLVRSKIHWQNQYRSLSGADGQFAIGALQNGDYVASVEDSIYVSTGGPVSFSVSDGTETSPLTLDVLEGGVVTGRIYDRDTNEGIAQARAMAYSYEPGHAREIRSTPSDSDGFYRIQGLPTDEHRISLDPVQGYPPARESRRVSVRPGETAEGIDFALCKGVPVAGVVLDENGRPAAHASVVAIAAGTNERNALRVQSGADGGFEHFGFQPGQSILLSAKKDNSASEAVGPFELGEEGLRGIELRLLEGASVEGDVVDRHGASVVRANVTANLIYEDTTVRPTRLVCDAKGRFRVTGLGPGRYRFVAQSAGAYAGGASVERALRAGAHVTGLRLVLGESSAGTISGRVVDAAGRPAAGGQVSAFAPEKRSAFAETDTDGAFSLAGLPEGRYTIAVTHLAYSATSVENVATGTRNVRIVVRPRGAVEGQVVSAVTGRPVSSFELSHTGEVFHFYEREFKPIRDDEGRFRIPDVGEGEMTILVRSPGYVQASADVEVRPDEVTRLTIRLESGMIVDGVVVDAAGTGVSGASVQAPDTDVLTYSGADGAFRVDTLPHTTTRLWARHPLFGYGVDEISDGAVRIVLSLGGTVEGRVTRDGTPVPDAYVQIDGQAGIERKFAQTDSTGAYRIFRVAPGEVQLNAAIVMQGKTQRQRAAAVVVEGQSTQVDFDFVSDDASQGEGAG